MSVNPIRLAFPSLCEFLTGSELDKDIELAISISKDGEEALRAAHQTGRFAKSVLTGNLIHAISPDWYGGVIRELETNLTFITLTLGRGVVRSTFYNKLLINDEYTFEDTCYEIAVTAKACAILDKGTIELEKKILDPTKKPKDQNNSDIYGKFQDQPVRIEVTVLHKKMPVEANLDLVDIVRNVEVASPFRLHLRLNLSDEAHAHRVMAIITKLHMRYLSGDESGVEVDGLQFTGRRGSYRSESPGSTIESLTFSSNDEFESGRTLAADFTEERHEIILPCVSRNLTPSYIHEDYPNPAGVVTLADLPDAPKDEPTSTKIGQMLGCKRRQCEEGVVNIIAFGIPSPMNDHDISDAVKGISMVTVPYTKDEHNNRISGQGQLSREYRAPFVPAETYLDDTARATFVDPFRKISAVWHIRFWQNPICRLILNPNATIPVPPELANKLETADE